MKNVRFWSKIDRRGAMTALRVGTREAWFALEPAGSNPMRAGITRAAMSDGRRALTVRLRVARVVIAGGVW